MNTAYNVRKKTQKKAKRYTEDGRPLGSKKVLILCVSMIVMAIIGSWSLSVTENYFESFMTNGPGAEEAMYYNNGLIFDETTASLDLNAKQQWALYTQSHLWDSISIQSKDGLPLSGLYHDAGSDTTVIVLHRFHENSNSAFPACLDLTGRDFNMLLVDARCHGESQGDFVSFGFLEQYDLAGWTTWANEQIRTNANGRLIIYGEGMGANTALFAASNQLLPNNVAFMLLESPYTSLADMATHTLTSYYTFPSTGIVTVLDYKLTKQHAGFTSEDTNLMAIIGNAKIPAIFLAGSKDSYIPYRSSHAVYSAYTSEKILIEDAVPHGIVSITQQDKLHNAIDELLSR